MAAMTGGVTQLQRLKGALRAWLERFFSGPWDAAYAEQRARIGRRHVEVKLPQHYMLTSMNLIRQQLTDQVYTLGEPPGRTGAAVRAVNKLCDIELAIMLHTYREDSERRAQRQERLATFGEMTSAVCHELRNPLGVIGSSTFILRRRLTGAGPAELEHLERVQRQVRRATCIINNMLDIVRSTPHNPQTISAMGLAEAAAEQLLEDRGFRVELLVRDPSLAVVADSAQVLQVLANLLGNAVDAAGPDGTVRLSMFPHPAEGGDHVRFLVSDSGQGVDAAIASRIFEPLVTTKETGIGLGLALSRKLAEQQPGILELVPGELSGAGFGLDLPRARPVDGSAGTSA